MLDCTFVSPRKSIAKAPIFVRDLRKILPHDVLFSVLLIQCIQEWKRERERIISSTEFLLHDSQVLGKNSRYIKLTKQLSKRFESASELSILCCRYLECDVISRTSLSLPHMHLWWISADRLYLRNTRRSRRVLAKFLAKRIFNEASFINTFIVYSSKVWSTMHNCV